ncbi:MAG: hypothetical protein U5N86_05400 [Planctomycetota bacterium]|nr:hypothetical protein [Planctomycetota bacterium]
MARIQKRLSADLLKKLGYSKGTHRGWTYTARSESELAEVADKAAVIFSTGEPKDTHVPVKLSLTDGRIFYAYCATLKRSMFGLLSPLSHHPFDQSFKGALLLKDANFPVLMPFALLRRGGLFETLQQVMLFEDEEDILPLPDYILSLENTPDIRCREIWRQMGKHLGEIHQSNVIAGIKTAAEVFVDRTEIDCISFRVSAGLSCERRHRVSVRNGGEIAASQLRVRPRNRRTRPLLPR